MGKYMDMARGGMMDDGMEAEPTTGNDIPPGSLAHEVADDQTIKVSGGEYIVPADVLQYYGVKFFENLRSKAKSHMAEMEQDGRIGGQPAEGKMVEREMAMMDDDLPFPEEEFMVEEVPDDGRTFAEGGYNPDTDWQSPTQVGGYGFGGPSGGRGFGGPGGGGVETRVYENAAGEKQYVLFMNGRPVNFIKDGFYPEGQVPTEQATSVVEEDKQRRQSEINENDKSAFIDPDREGVTRSSFDPSNWTVEDIEAFSNRRDWQTPLAKGASLLGPIGMIGGLIYETFQGRKTRQVIDEIEQRIANGTIDLETGTRLKQELADNTGTKINGILDTLGLTPEQKKEATSVIADTDPVVGSAVQKASETSSSEYSPAPRPELSFGSDVGKTSLGSGITSSDLSFDKGIGSTSPTSTTSSDYSLGTPDTGYTPPSTYSLGTKESNDDNDKGSTGSSSSGSGSTSSTSSSSSSGSGSSSQRDWSSSNTKADSGSMYDGGSNSRSTSGTGAAGWMGARGGLVKKRAKFKSNRK